MVAPLIVLAALAAAQAQEPSPTAESPSSSEATGPWSSASSTEQPEAPRAEPAASPPSAEPATETATETARVLHLPPSEVTAGQPLELTLALDDISAVDQLVLQWRPLGTTDWREVGFTRTDRRYVARIPAREVHRPGLEYTIVTRDAVGTSTPRFASPSRPQPVPVSGESSASRERRRLADYDGKRSAFSVTGGGASYGQLPGAAADWQWDVGASFLFRPLLALHAMEFRFDRMRGQSPRQRINPTDGSLVATPQAQEAGYNRGAANAHFALGEVVGLLVGAELGVDLVGFTAGASTGLRFGRPTGTHVWATYSGVGGIGQTATLAMHWDTVPRLPMYAGLDITTWPTGGETWATRIRTGLQVPLGDTLGLDLEGSYQARSALAGGPGGRGGLTWSF